MYIDTYMCTEACVAVMQAQGRFSVDAHTPNGGLAEYLHKAIHEEWQVGYTPHL